MEPLKRRKVRQGQSENVQHDAVQWQTENQDQLQNGNSYAQQFFTIDADTTLAPNVHPASTAMQTSMHPILAQQQLENVNEAQPYGSNGMLTGSLNNGTTFPYMSDHVRVDSGTSVYSSQNGAPSVDDPSLSLTASAPGLTSMHMTALAGTNQHAHGQQIMEPTSVLPQLNSTSLQVGNLFDNVDFNVDALGFSSPMPLIHQRSDTMPSLVRPPPPMLSKQNSIQTVAQAPSPEEKRIDTRKAESRDSHVFSRIGTPLPSLHTLPGLGFKRRESASVPETASGPCWKVSQADYLELQSEVTRYSDVLPSKFNLPSRHTMSAYLERCINSLYKHQPFFHIPSFKAGKVPLELVLAMCATGAQLRFDGETGVPLFHASKALIMSRLQGRHEETILNSLELPHRSRSENKSVVSSRSPELARRSSLENDNQSSTSSNESQSRVEDIRTTSRQRLQTMQTVLTLMSFGSWGLKGLLGETIILQSLLTMLAREEGLEQESEITLEQSGTAQELWQTWINVESWRRVKIITYTFTNLQTLAFNMAPPLASAEVQCQTPGSADEWAATDSQRWLELRNASRITAVPFQVAFRDLFRRENEDMTIIPHGKTISALGSYALIFGVLQCIFFLRQRHPVAYLSNVDANATSNLREDDIESIIAALHKWQRLWEKCPESTIEPEAQAGPISFNAIACLRLAWIRLYADLGPSRHLATRDPKVIARVFGSMPPFQRNPKLYPVLLQAIHALSVPVRLGIKFVARSQSLFWSMNQSLCALECAVILSSWFETLAATIAQSPMSRHEKSLVMMLRSMVLESGFFTDEDIAELPPGAESRENASSSPNFGAAFDGSMGHDNINGQSLAFEDFSNDARIFGMADLENWASQEVAMPTPPSPKEDATAWQKQIFSIKVAVARLWAEVFSDNHVFDLVTTIGRTLNLHSKTLEGK